VKRLLDLADDIEAHEDEASEIRRGIDHEGPNVIRALQDRGGWGACSLRQIGRESGLSPTYLSQAASGKAILSPGAFVKLVRLLNKSRKAVRG
jgi:hypothetical protein